MFSVLKRPFQEAGSAWLGKRRVFTLTLSNVEDYLDAHSLWEEGYGGKKGIIECLSGKSAFRLKSALDLHRFIVFETDKRRWYTEVERVFTDVVLWIPNAVWQNEIEVAPERLMAVASTLARLHEVDFGAESLAGRRPSFVVMPDQSIPEGSLSFQFGPGVFVPCKDDKLVATVEVQVAGATEWRPLPEWIFWEKGKERRLPPALYEGQRGLSLGAETAEAAVRVCAGGERPTWFSHGKGNIFVNYPLEREHFAFGDGKFVSKGEVVPGEKSGGQSILVFKDLLHGPRDPSDKQEVLSLRVTPVKPDARKESHKPLPRSPMQEARRVKTVRLEGQRASGDVAVGELGPYLLLEGYALPRIDVSKVPGLEAWTLLMDDNGKAVNDPVPDPKGKLAFLSLSARSDKDMLFVRKPGEHEYHAVLRYPWQYTSKSRVFYEIAPSPFPEEYFGILQVPGPDRFIPLEEDRPIVLGRSDPTPERAPDVCLDVLTSPQGHRGQGGCGDPCPSGPACGAGWKR